MVPHPRTGLFVLQHGDAAPSDIERPRSTISGGATRSGTTAAMAWNMQSYLARPEKPEDETSSRPTRPPIVGETSNPDPDPDHQFFTGEAHVELRKMLPASVQVCVTSPPSYWPAAASITCWRTAPFHCPRPTTSATSRRGKATSTMSCDAISARSSACCGRMALCSLCSTMLSRSGERYLCRSAARGLWSIYKLAGNINLTQ